MLLDPVLKRLRPRAQKSVPLSHYFDGVAFGDASWARTDNGVRVERSLRHNPVVYRCVRMIAEACASIPLQVYENDLRNKSHPLGQILARPNPSQSGSELLETLYTYLLLHGNAYLEVVGDEKPEGLYSLRPERMRFVAGENGWIEYYEYSAGGKTKRYDQSKTLAPILHLKLFNPQDDYYGLSPLESASLAINIHNAANGWNKSLFENAARPSGALVYRGQDGNAHLTDEQFTRLKQELENNFQGAQNAGRPLLLEGGLDWSSISLSPQDMDFIAAKHSAARDIALAFGVPPMLLGIPGDNTYANYAEANRAFWRQTILPLAERITSKLTLHLCELGEHLALVLDNISALSEERQRLWRRIDKAGFLTQDEKRAAIGYPPLDETQKENS